MTQTHELILEDLEVDLEVNFEVVLEVNLKVNLGVTLEVDIGVSPTAQLAARHITGQRGRVRYLVVLRNAI